MRTTTAPASPSASAVPRSRSSPDTAEFLTQRLGKPADGFLAVGDVEDIMALLQRFREAGVHKFILRPIAHGTEDFIDQTRLLIERVLPEVAALN